MRYSLAPGRKPFSCQLITKTYAAHRMGQNNCVIFPLVLSALAELATVDCAGVQGSVFLFSIHLVPSPRGLYPAASSLWGPAQRLVFPSRLGGPEKALLSSTEQAWVFASLLAQHPQGKAFSGVGRHIRQLWCLTGLKKSPDSATSSETGRGQAPRQGLTSSSFC